MATTYSVGLEFSAKTRELDAAVNKLKGLDAKAKGAANSIRPIGGAAKGAAVGVKTLGAAFNAALGPIGAALSGIAGLTAAFRTLSTQDFAEAKVKTLGVNATDLKKRLEGVSR